MLMFFSRFTVWSPRCANWDHENIMTYLVCVVTPSLSFLEGEPPQFFTENILKFYIGTSGHFHFYSSVPDTHQCRCQPALSDHTIIFAGRCQQHKNGRWHIETHPIISLIMFSRSTFIGWFAGWLLSKCLDSGSQPSINASPRNLHTSWCGVKP